MSIPGLFVGAVLAVGAAPLASANDTIADALTSHLTTLRDGGPGTYVRVLAKVVNLGPEAVPVILALRVGRLAPTTEEGPLLDATGRDLLDEALLAWSPRRVGEELLGTLDPEANFHEHLAAIALLGHAGDVRSLAGLLEGYAELGPEWLASPRFHAAVESAFDRALERERDSASLVLAFTDDLPSEVLPSIARALAHDESSNSVDALKHLLGRDTQTDVAALASLGDLSVRGAIDDDGSRAHVLRPYLEADDPTVRRQAALSLGALHDTESFLQLTELLGDPDRRVKKAALVAVVEIAGVGWAADARWAEWHAAEWTWFEQTGQAAMAELDLAPAGRAVRIVRDISAHGLHRRAAAEALTRALRRPERQVALAAAAGLQRLGEPSSIPALIVALEDNRAIVRHTSLAALQAVTGETIPDDIEAWQHWLDP